MKPAKDLGKELYAKRQEMAEFIKTNSDTVEGKPVFNWKGFENSDSEAGIKSFNDRNAELSKLQDEFVKATQLEDAAQKNDDEIKSLEEVVRKLPFSARQSPDLDTMGEGARQNAYKTLGQLFMESEEYKNYSSKGPDVVQQWAAEIKADISTCGPSYAMKTALSTSTGVVPYPAARPGIVDYATQRPVIRNLLTVGDPQAQMVQFIRQNVQTFGADIVAEGAAKPETSLGTERVVITLEAIAHYIKVTNQALEFIPGARDLIDRKGTLGLALAEEDKILNYNGSAGWKGFLYQSGLQSDSVGSDDQFTAFHRAMTLVQTVGFANVTGAVMHPNDWHQIVTITDDLGRFIYGDPSTAEQAPRLWGVPIVTTTKMTEGTMLQGDFVMDAKLWVAGGVRILVGYVNDDLTKNQQTIVIEEYAALEIDRPASFVKQTGY